MGYQICSTPCERLTILICAEIDFCNLLVRESPEIYPKRLYTFLTVYLQSKREYSGRIMKALKSTFACCHAKEFLLLQISSVTCFFKSSHVFYVF